MGKKDGKETAEIPIVEQKPKKKKIKDVLENEKSILQQIKISNAEKEPYEKKVVIDKIIDAHEEPTQIQIAGQPTDSKDQPEEMLIDFEVTEEMIEYSLKGIFGTIHTLAPKKFNEPTTENIKSLTPPAVIVVKRWIKRIDILKYLPELSLAAGIIAVINDMKVKDENQT